MRFVLLSFLLWRVLLFLPLLAGELFLSYRSGYEYTNLWKFIPPYQPVSTFLLYPWANFDGVHYLRIAGEGYTNNLGFFPLFPVTIKGLSFVFGGGQTFGAAQFFSGLLIANLSFLAALFTLYKLIRLDYSEKTARLAILFTLLFPTSFYFGSVYSESLFFLLALLSLFFARKRRWVVSSISGFLLLITRPVGIAILPALFYEFFTQEGKSLKKLVSAGLALLVVPLGLLGYAFFNWVKTGNWFSFIAAHGALGKTRSVDSIVLPPQTLFRYIKILLALPYFKYEWWIALLELTTFVCVTLLLFYAWRKEIRHSYISFALVAFLIPVLGGTFNGLPRYALVLFPIFITLALIKNRLIQVAYVVISVVLLFVLLMFFSKGYFIA